MEISELFKELNDNVIAHSFDLKGPKLGNLTTNLDQSGDQDIVFYRLASSKEALATFKARLEKASFGALIISGDLESRDLSKSNMAIIREESFLTFQQKLSQVFYPLNNEIKVAGVTGTNGKTSTVNLALELLESIGVSAISIGTLGVKSKNDLLEEGGLTAPSYLDLKRILYQYQKLAQVFLLEVSSHSLSQNRLGEIKLDIVAWTNFGQDHLDYHKDLESYFEAKKKILELRKDPFSSLLVAKTESFYLNKISPDKIRVCPTLKELGYTSLPFQFRPQFVQNNLELAFEMVRGLCGKTPKINLEKIPLPKGRCEFISLGDRQVMIDYAHTPDALENILKNIPEMWNPEKVHLLFGCGGNRDKTKRPMMGALASNYLKEGSNKIYLTSDNPRNENPEVIIDEIADGVSGNAHLIKIPNRKEAIQKALENLKDQELLIIAGKGHEMTQEIQGKKLPFSDHLIVQEFKNNYQGMESASN